MIALGEQRRRVSRRAHRVPGVQCASGAPFTRDFPDLTSHRTRARWWRVRATRRDATRRDATRRRLARSLARSRPITMGAFAAEDGADSRAAIRRDCRVSSPRSPALDCRTPFGYVVECVRQNVRQGPLLCGGFLLLPVLANLLNGQSKNFNSSTVCSSFLLPFRCPCRCLSLSYF